MAPRKPRKQTSRTPRQLPDEIPLFMSAPEAASLLGVKAARVKKWWLNGELDASNLGDAGQTRLKIYRDDLLKFLDRRKRQKPSAPVPAPQRRGRRREENQLIERY